MSRVTDQESSSKIERLGHSCVTSPVIALGFEYLEFLTDAAEHHGTDGIPVIGVDAVWSWRDQIHPMVFRALRHDDVSIGVLIDKERHGGQLSLAKQFLERGRSEIQRTIEKKRLPAQPQVDLLAQFRLRPICEKDVFCFDTLDAIRPLVIDLNPTFILNEIKD